MIEMLSQPWPWYISGPAIAFIMSILIFSGKTCPQRGLHPENFVICIQIQCDKQTPPVAAVQSWIDA